MTLGVDLIWGEVVRNEESPKRDLLSKNTDARWRSGVTANTESEKIERERGERETERTRAVVAPVMEGEDERSAVNARNDPRAEIRRRAEFDDERRTTKEAGERRMRSKRDSPKSVLPIGLCKRDIKISLQIASTTFPFRSPSAYRIEARETAFVVPLRSFACSLPSRSLLVLSCAHIHIRILLTRPDGNGDGFFCNRRVSATANRLRSNFCPFRHCNDPRCLCAGLTSRCSLIYRRHSITFTSLGSKVGY